MKAYGVGLRVPSASLEHSGQNGPGRPGGALAATLSSVPTWDGGSRLRRTNKPQDPNQPGQPSEVIAIFQAPVAWIAIQVRGEKPDSHRSSAAAEAVPDPSGDHGQIALAEAARAEHHHLLVEPRRIGEHRR